MTADFEYSHSNREDLLLAIQMRLSEKVKTFYQLSVAFFEATLNLERFTKKNHPQTLSIFEFIDSGIHDYLNE